MGIFNTINTSATGLTAERMRIEVISQNIANANTTRTSSGMPYRRKMVLFKEKNEVPFSSYLSKYSKAQINGQGVEVSKIVEDKSSFKKVYDPGHPDANKDGYVQMPNLDILKEMVDMMSASRSYEANITALNTTKSMLLKSLEIGKR